MENSSSLGFPLYETDLPELRYWAKQIPASHQALDDYNILPCSPINQFKWKICHLCGRQPPDSHHFQSEKIQSTKYPFFPICLQQ